MSIQFVFGFFYNVLDFFIENTKEILRVSYEFFLSKIGYVSVVEEGNTLQEKEITVEERSERDEQVFLASVHSNEVLKTTPALKEFEDELLVTVEESPVPNNVVQCESRLEEEVADAFGLSQEQWMKVGLVAAAVLFSPMLGDSTLGRLKVGLCLSAITLIAEKYLRKGTYLENSWLDWSKINKGNILKVSAGLVALKNALPLGAALLGYSENPQQRVMLLIRAGDVQTIFAACVCGPISEEIIFRGFVQERIEDFVYLVSNWTGFVGKGFVQTVANLGQAFLFGRVHITGDQVVGSKLAVCIRTGIPGFFYGQVKNQESLLPPIVYHATSNAGATLVALVSSALR